jgi:hypothetical protein
VKILQSEKYTKLAYLSVDDQPNFVKRDRKGQGETIFVDPAPSSESETKKKWTKKRKWKKKKKPKLPESVI